ncbi:carboxypeptidase-like regulatory domain-containing protein [Aureivirga sp. CE67]|uniref:carboxypeptidase-like regulatory domain-containing protein n=1 Tax=Aureivirga sp. CE67 TaxID=1788983 RepID=UPI0018C9BE97|nr:carboxypeptidase-like regulatory domain-containing protein [Aureivirga sp. CE67]
MYLKNILLVFFLFGTTITFAQKTTITGTVKDSTGVAMELANVLAVNPETKAIKKFAITDTQGQFKLVVPNDEKIVLQVSYLGYAMKEVPVDFTGNPKTLTFNIVLDQEDNTLDEVEITYEIPITIQGDTIVYTTDAFTNGKEKKLEDVLKKLPGVEVNEDGEIEVEGKTVSKVMVEGKDFFDGDSKLATKNIPADAISKIEVLKNHNDVAPIRGLEDDSDNIAMNILLKEGKKNFWFGEINAAGGVENRYSFNPKLFYYSPEKSINIIGNINNTGEVPFTFRDYIKFSGGFKNLMRKGGSSINLSSNLAGFNFFQDTKVQEITSKFGAANFSFSTKESKWDFNGFAIFNESRTDNKTQSQRTFIETNETEIDSDNTSLQKSQLGLLKFSATNKPSVDTHFEYDALFKIAKQTEDGGLNSSIKGDIQTVNEDLPISFNQNIGYHHTINEKNIISLAGQHLYTKEKPIYEAIIDSPTGESPFQSIPFVTQNVYDIQQNRDIHTNKIDAKADYYYVLNNKSNLNFTLGNTTNIQKLTSDITQTLEDGTKVYFSDDNLNNDVSYTFSDIFLSLHYKVKLGKFLLLPGVSVHQYLIQNKQLGITQNDNEIRFLGDFLAEYEFTSSETLRFKYNVTNEFSDINNIAEGSIFTNYNSLQKGNRNLESAQYHNYNLSYSNINMFSFTNIFANVNYSRKMDAIKNFIDISGIDQESTPINSDFTDEALSARGSIDKNFGKYKLGFTANGNYSKFYNIINTQYQTSESFTHSYQLKVNTNFDEFPNIELGYKKSFSDYNLASNKTTYITDKPFVRIEYSFLKNFTIDANYDYYNYRDKDDTIENTYAFLDANLYYQKEGSKWEFKVSATNLLDTKTVEDNSFSQTFQRTTTYYVQPRYILFGVKYQI